MTKFYWDGVAILLRVMCTVFIGIIIPFQASSIEVKGLYDVEIPVVNQSREVQQSAFKQALAVVMVRISGNTAVEEIPGVEKITALSSRFVRKFQYRAFTTEEETLINQQTDPSQDLMTRMLVISFDGKAVEKQLRENQISTWGYSRPQVLLWVGVEQKRQRQILSDSGSNQIKSLIIRAAKRRGIPLIFPQLDLEDRNIIQFADIRGDYSPAIKEASSRYDSEIVLTGIVSQTASGSWYAQWTVYRDNVSSAWTTRQELNYVLDSGIDGVADILVSRYAEHSLQRATQNELRLQVDQINSVQDYARSMNYLASLSVVESIHPEKISANSIQYRLLIRGELYHLERAIAIEKVLLPLEVKGNTSSIVQNSQIIPGMVDLHYRLFH